MSRYVYPLFSNSGPLPALTSVQQRLCASLFKRGSRYLGDEESMLRVGVGEDGAPLPPSPSHRLPTTWSGSDSSPSGSGGGGTGSVPWVELAFMGRSNAGKSTLLNALLGGKPGEGLKAFVPVSSTPGTTSRLDFYAAGEATPPSLVLVDTPGYGFSARGKAAHGVWMQRMAQYLRTRRTMSSHATGSPLLARVILMADTRVGLTDMDKRVLTALEDTLLPLHLVLSKCDLATPRETAAAIGDATRTLAALNMPFPHLSLLSAATGQGMEEFLAVLMHLSKVHRLNRQDSVEHMKEVYRVREEEERRGAAAPAAVGGGGASSTTSAGTSAGGGDGETKQ